MNDKIEKKQIDEILNNIEYGTLALSQNNKPYSLPINFVAIEENIYFHGSKSGRKINLLKSNKQVSFSVVEPYSLIPSFFSSKAKMACPATHFFNSIIIDGVVEFVTDYKEKVLALSELMKKLQPEGKYQDLDKNIYEKSINAVTVFKLIPNNVQIKMKFGQQLNDERFEMIIHHLSVRNSEKDQQTIELMKKYRLNITK